MSSDPPRASIEYVGHGTVLVDLAGVKLLTDPLLRNRVTHLRRAAKVDAAALRGVDAVLISHLHYDHLDMPSLQRLGREMPVVAPKGAGALIKRQAGITNVTEMRAGEEIQIGALTVRAVPAEHDTGRLPFGARAEPLGYVIEGAGRSVYFAGDTDVFPGMAELAPRRCRAAPDLGLGADDGAGPHGSGRAAEAAALLGARLAIPIHWGTYYPVHLGLRGPPGFLETPAPLFEQAMRRALACDRGAGAPARRANGYLSSGCCGRRGTTRHPRAPSGGTRSGPTRSLIPVRSKRSVRSVLARANSSVTPLSSS